MISLSLSLSLSCIYCIFLKNQYKSFDSLSIWFCWENLPPNGPGFFWLYLPHVQHLLQLSLWFPCFLYLKYFKAAEIYSSVFSRQYPIITSLGIKDLLNVKMYVSLYFFITACNGYPFVSHDPCFPKVDFISSSVHWDNSLFLITLFEWLSFSCRWILHFKLWKIFILIRSLKILVIYFY